LHAVTISAVDSADADVARASRQKSVAIPGYLPGASIEQVGGDAVPHVALAPSLSLLLVDYRLAVPSSLRADAPSDAERDRLRDECDAEHQDDPESGHGMDSSLGSKGSKSGTTRKARTIRSLQDAAATA
jgi:hypothetical protein